MSEKTSKELYIFVKWAIPVVLFLWGFFCMMKSYGYCDIHPKKVYICSEEYQFLKMRLPLDREFEYQTPPCNFGKWVNPYDHVWEGNPYLPKNDISKKEYQEKYEFHMFHAKRTYEDAKSHVWWIPDISWRQRGREAWVAAFSTVGAKTLQLKLLAAVSSLLCQYGLDCLDEWEYIEEKLKWSTYHLEQCEIYANKI